MRAQLVLCEAVRVPKSNLLHSLKTLNMCHNVALTIWILVNARLATCHQVESSMLDGRPEDDGPIDDNLGG